MAIVVPVGDQAIDLRSVPESGEVDSVCSEPASRTLNVRRPLAITASFEPSGCHAKGFSTASPRDGRTDNSDVDQTGPTESCQ